MTAAAVGGFTIVRRIADAAPGHQTLTARRVTLAGAAPNREARERRVALVVGNSNYERQTSFASHEDAAGAAEGRLSNPARCRSE